jgi:pentatricopeptide repeat protein
MRGGFVSVQMFTSAIYSQKYTGSYIKAEELLESLRILSIAQDSRSAKNKKSLKVTIAPFNALLAVYSATNAPLERKRHLFTDICNLNLTWDTFTYTAAFMNERNKTLIIELWKRLSADNVINPSYVSIIKVLNACVILKDAVTALDVINYLWSRLDLLSSRSLTQTNDYISLRKLMPDANENRIYCLVLTALYKSGSVDESWDLMTQIRMRGFSPTYSMYMIVLRALKVKMKHINKKYYIE